MKLLDLFAGIGGFSLAAHWMGWETVAFVERDKFCQRVLRKNFGDDIEIYDDITTFSGQPFRGRVDIISGGFPCQPASEAGKRKGKDDDRYLFPEMLRVVDEVRPAWVVPENVRGLLYVDDGRLFEEICSSMESIGYAVQTFCVPASSVGAPHRRDRLWLIAHDTECPRCAGRASSPQTVTDSDRAKDGLSQSANSDTSDTEHERRNNRSDNGLGRNDHGNGRTSEARGNAGIGRVRADTSPNRSIVTNAKGPKLADSGRTAEQDGRSGPTNRRWNEPWPEVAARFCRVDDVVPNRVDRLKALGNAIVPKIAYEIFKAIESADAQRQSNKMHKS